MRFLSLVVVGITAMVAVVFLITNAGTSAQTASPTATPSSTPTLTATPAGTPTATFPGIPDPNKLCPDLLLALVGQQFVPAIIDLKVSPLSSAADLNRYEADIAAA